MFISIILYIVVMPLDIIVESTGQMQVLLMQA